MTSEGIGLYEWDPVRRELRWDSTLERVFAADRPGETPFETWLRRVHPEDQPRVLETFSRLREAEDLYRVVLDDGTIRYVLSRATTVVTDDAGAPTRVAGVMVDVTMAHEAAARIEDILESISDGFLSLDTDFRVTYMNPAAERILGYGREELLDRSIWESFPHAVGTKFDEVYSDVMDRRVARSFEEYYPQPLNMWIEVSAQPAGEGIVVYFRDVTERHARDEEREALLRAERTARTALAHQAAHDQLTGLLNRSEITRQGQALLDASHRLTLLFLDLDRFKLVNDSLGHAAGDELLVVMGRRLASALRPRDRCARLGGDEFVVLLDGPDTADAEKVATRILHDIRRPTRAGRRDLTVSISIGMAEAAPDATFDTLLRDADIALYRAKAAGRDRFAWYDRHIHSELVEQVALEADLRSALAAGSLDVNYQPMVSLASGRLSGVEALARWHHAELGPVSPLRFIPLAEDAGLIDAVGAAVLDRASRQAAAWRAIPDFRVWINVSPRQFQAPGLAAGILARLDGAGVEPGRFGIEITESALADDVDAHGELGALSAAGIAIAIDDFGTGYSSLARLQDLPIDVLKIDQSFVRKSGSAAGRAAVKAVIQLAHALGMTTIAEGIETDEHLAVLRDLGSDHGSGYLFARPAPADEVVQAHRADGALAWTND